MLIYEPPTFSLYTHCPRRCRPHRRMCMHNMHMHMHMHTCTCTHAHAHVHVRCTRWLYQSRKDSKPARARLGPKFRDNSKPAWDDFAQHTLPLTPTPGARRGVLVAVAAVKTRQRQARTFGRSGEPARARAQPGIWSLRVPVMASSQGDVWSTPMAYPAVRTLPKLPLPLRPETWSTS